MQYNVPTYNPQNFQPMVPVNQANAPEKEQESQKKEEAPKPE